MKKTRVVVPKPGPIRSPLDGIERVAIDTDPDRNLPAFLEGARAQGVDILAVIPRSFPGADGYLVITYDQTKAK